jgi:hypothetical protein
MLMFEMPRSSLLLPSARVRSTPQSIDVPAKSGSHGDDTNSPRQRTAAEARNHTNAKSGRNERELGRMFAGSMGDYRFMTARSKCVNQPLITPSGRDVQVAEHGSGLPLARTTRRCPHSQCSLEFPLRYWHSFWLAWCHCVVKISPEG